MFNKWGWLSENTLCVFGNVLVFRSSFDSAHYLTRPSVIQNLHVSSFMFATYERPEQTKVCTEQFGHHFSHMVECWFSEAVAKIMSACYRLLNKHLRASRNMISNVKKGSFCHVLAMQSQVSLWVRAVWSRTSLSEYRINSYCRIYRLTEKVVIRLC